MQTPLLWIGAFEFFLVFTPRGVGVSTLSLPGLLCCPVGVKEMTAGVPIQMRSLDHSTQGKLGPAWGWGFAPQSKDWQRSTEPPWQTRLFRPHTPGAGAQAASGCPARWCEQSPSELLVKNSSCRMSPASPGELLGMFWSDPSVPLPMESISTNRCTPAPWLLSVFHLSPSACPSVSLICFLFAVLCVWQRDIS